MPAVVQLSTVPTWAQDLQGLHGIAIDVTRDVFTLTSALVGGPAFRFDDADPGDSRILFAVQRAASFELVSAEMDGGSPALSSPLPPGDVPRRIVLDRNAGVVWVITLQQATGLLRALAYDEATLGLLDSWDAPSGTGDGFGEFNIALESDGTLWIIPLFEDRAFALHTAAGAIVDETAGAGNEIVASPGNIFTSGSVRSTLSVEIHETSARSPSWSSAVLATTRWR